MEDVTLKMRATEPNFESLPPWLDPNNRDDRIVAAALEIVKEYPSSNIAVLSNDLNMHNKCSLAGIACLEFNTSQLDASLRNR